MRRDPAPSRLRYRLQRVWMRPLARLTICVGLPLAALSGTGAWHLSDPANVARVAEAVAEARRAVEDHERFAVTALRIEGADGPLTAATRVALAQPLPESRLRLDRAALRARVLALPQVAAVGIAVEAGELRVAVTPRVPVALHRGTAGLHVVDAEGVRLIALARRSERPDLPMLAGPGADRAAGEALEVLAAAGPLGPRVAGLVRRGQRRWDVVLDNGQRVLLPAAEPAAAMRRAAEAAGAGLFERAVAHLDLRDPARVVVRRLPGPPEA